MMGTRTNQQVNIYVNYIYYRHGLYTASLDAVKNT